MGKKDKPVSKARKGGMQGPNTAEPRKGNENRLRDTQGKPYTGTVGPSFGQGSLYRGNKPA